MKRKCSISFVQFAKCKLKKKKLLFWSCDFFHALQNARYKKAFSCTHSIKKKFFCTMEKLLNSDSLVALMKVMGRSNLPPTSPFYTNKVNMYVSQLLTSPYSSSPFPQTSAGSEKKLHIWPLRCFPKVASAHEILHLIHTNQTLQERKPYSYWHDWSRPRTSA